MAASVAAPDEVSSAYESLLYTNDLVSLYKVQTCPAFSILAAYFGKSITCMLPKNQGKHKVS